MRIVYVHGLGSGSNSHTCSVLKEILKDDEILSPEIPVEPEASVRFLRAYIRDTKPDLVVASSLGAFYTLFCDGCFKLLINPALVPDENISSSIGKGTFKFLCKRNDNKEEYTINDDFIQSLSKLRARLYIDIDTRYETYALFSKDDELFSNFSIFNKLFNSSHAKMIEGNHRLNKEQIIDSVIPMINRIKEICDYKKDL